MKEANVITLTASVCVLLYVTDIFTLNDAVIYFSIFTASFLLGILIGKIVTKIK